MPGLFAMDDAREAPAQLGLALCAYVSILVLALVLGFLLRESWPVLSGKGLWHFLTDSAWFPLEKQFGMTPMLVGSMLIALGAMLLAAPLGLACAIAEKCLLDRRLGALLKLAMSLLAGVPSVVFGLWGLTVVVPIIAAWQAPGTSLLAASIVLALMILPTIALTSSAALAAVPREQWQGAAALGLTRSASILGVALPAARAGIVSGMVLAVARALGETMAVLMVAGNVVQVPASVFDPVRALTTNIALEMGYAAGEHRATLFVSGLVLVIAVLLLTWMARRHET
jgi:phosphate transport system permease protein